MKTFMHAAAVLLIAASILEAGEIGAMHTFTAGTPAVADEVNANFNEQTAQINDNNGRISANSAAITATGLLGWTALSVSNPPASTYIGDTLEFIKISDLGTYAKRVDDSVLEIQFNGRLCATGMDADYIVFELRVDDAPVTQGVARALLEYEEYEAVPGAGCAVGTPVTISGIFEDLPAGTRTVSMWGKPSFSLSGAQGIRYNPNNEDVAHLSIKEFGTR